MNICLGLIRFHKKILLFTPSQVFCTFKPVVFWVNIMLVFRLRRLCSWQNESLERHTAHHFYLPKRQCCSLTWQWFAFEYRGKQIHIAVLSFTMVWFGLFVNFLLMMFVMSLRLDCEWDAVVQEAAMAQGRMCVCVWISVSWLTRSVLTSKLYKINKKIKLFKGLFV